MQREVARRQSSPFTGKLSARPAGKPGDWIAKESLRRSLRRHWLAAPVKILRRLSMRFQGMAESIGPMWSNCNQPWGGTGRLPLAGPVAQSKERVGRTTLFSSSAMSSDRLFLDQVARQHCLSPLHRHEQINMSSSKARAKEDISTLPAWGHFYFALTETRCAWAGASVCDRLHERCVSFLFCF